MGKTSKPLWIVVHDALVQSEQFQRLAEQGHRVQPLTSSTGDDLMEADLVVGPKMWRMDPTLLKYLDSAIKGARAVAYPTKPKGD